MAIKFGQTIDNAGGVIQLCSTNRGSIDSSLWLEMKCKNLDRKSSTDQCSDLRSPCSCPNPDNFVIFCPYWRPPWQPPFPKQWGGKLCQTIRSKICWMPWDATLWLVPPRTSYSCDHKFGPLQYCNDDGWIQPCWLYFGKSLQTSLGHRAFQRVEHSPVFMRTTATMHEHGTRWSMMNLFDLGSPNISGHGWEICSSWALQKWPRRVDNLHFSLHRLGSYHPTEANKSATQSSIPSLSERWMDLEKLFEDSNSN